MDTVGDGSGTDNLIGNYSATASAVTIAYIASAPGADLYRLIFSLKDTSGMLADEYGNGSALLVGYSFEVLDADLNSILDLNDGLKIQDNSDFATLCYDVDVKSWGTTPTNELLTARWTFERAGSPLQLDPYFRIQATLNDDFTGLLSHRFMIQGVQGY